MKISILRRLFHLYHKDLSDLVFYLRDAKQDEKAEHNRFLYRKKYWSYALPLLKEANAENGYFDNCNIPSQTNYVEGHFSVSGCSISCSASHYGARVRLYLGKSNSAENKRLFDAFKQRQSEIERTVGIPLEWERGDHQKASVIAYSLAGVSITNEQDWPIMAKFHSNGAESLRMFLFQYCNLYDNSKNRALRARFPLTLEHMFYGKVCLWCLRLDRSRGGACGSRG